MFVEARARTFHPGLLILAALSLAVLDSACGGGESTTTPHPTPAAQEGSVSQRITAANAGSVSLGDAITLDIPAGAPANPPMIPEKKMSQPRIKSVVTTSETPTYFPTVTPTTEPLSIRYAIAAHIWPEPLNVRPDPSTKNKELSRLSEGERLEVISGPTSNDGRNWWKVRLADGREGYMAGEFLFLSYAAFGVAREDNNGNAVLAIRDGDILKDGSLLLSLAFTNVSSSAQGWTSDTGNTNIYLTDESGERYASLEVGGAFAANLAQSLKPNETMTGWYRFSAPPDLLDRLSTNTLEGLGALTLHYPNHEPIEFRLR